MVYYNSIHTPMKLISNLLSITILSLFIFPSHPPQAKAEITTNDNWTVEIDNIDITSQSPVKNQNKQAPQEAPKGIFTGTNYKIQTGLTLNPLEQLSLSISNNLIDYGIISPTNPIYRTSNLIISSSTLKNFMVSAYENHPLLTADTNTQIPDSTCDNGSCSQTTSAPWSNTLTYGFGYRCENATGTNCPADMKESDYYRQFSNPTKNEAPETIITGNITPDKKNEVQLTYKINTSKNQAPGLYSNAITYIVAPGY